MFRKIEDRFGTAGLVVAVVALIAALGGSAYAANGALTSKQKNEVTKIAKKYAGKPGNPGAPGPSGSAGGSGKDGSNGTNGTNGTDGTDGSDGSDGNSVVVANEDPAGCTEGGVTYEVDGSGEENEICNGEEGVPGEPGDPWSVGGTLPPGKTWTGSWSFGTAKQSDYRVPIDFPLPLPAPITGETKIHTVGVGGTAPAGCTGGTAASPKADPGHFCLYAGHFINANYSTIDIFLGLTPVNSPSDEFGTIVATGTTGAILRFNSPETALNSNGWGSWAVTAPTP